MAENTSGPHVEKTLAAVRAKLREAARENGFDPTLAEAALDPGETIAPELLDMLRLTGETLVKHAPGKQTPEK